MNSLVSNLKEMLKLEERREQLVRELDGLTGKLGQLTRMFNFGPSDAGSSASSAGSSPRTRRGRKTKASKAPKIPRTSKAGRKARAPRGAMKQSITSELEKAGAQGIGVKELSAILGVRNTAVHAWFNTTGKKVKEIKKVGKARYALAGSPSSAKTSPIALKASRPAKKGRPAKTAKSSRAGRSTSGRGELMRAITATLQKAGSKGMTVREMSEKLNVPYKNVYIWFVTTGKKNKSIERTAPATYRMQS